MKNEISKSGNEYFLAQKKKLNRISIIEYRLKFQIEKIKLYERVNIFLIVEDSLDTNEQGIISSRFSIVFTI